MDFLGGETVSEASGEMMMEEPPEWIGVVAELLPEAELGNADVEVCTRRLWFWLGPCLCFGIGCCCCCCCDGGGGNGCWWWCCCCCGGGNSDCDCCCCCCCLACAVVPVGLPTPPKACDAACTSEARGFWCGTSGAPLD